MRHKAIPIASRGAQRRQPTAPSSRSTPPTTSRVKDWALTLPMLALLPVLLIPLLVIAAGGPTLSVGAGLQPAGPIVVSGLGFEKREYVELSWDGQPVSWLPTTKTDRSGAFVVSSVLPADLAPGAHLIEARMKKNGRDSVARPEVIAGVAVTIAAGAPVAPAPIAPPPPTPTPTPTPTAAPATAAPTPTPTATAKAPIISNPTPTPTPTPSAAAPVPAPGDARLTCAGYPEPRVFLESQDHWSPIPDLGTLGHVHVGTCFPLGQTVSGVVEFDVRVVLFENKGTLARVKMQDDASTDHVVIKPNITPPDGGERIYWFNVKVDTRNMADGVRQFRWYADVEHTNGNTQTARSSWPLDVENGKADAGVSGSALELRFLNWYRVEKPTRNWGYIGPTVGGMPMSAVSGSFAIDVNCSVNGDSGSPGISKTIVHVDPNFHHGSDGKIVYEGQPLGGRLTVSTAGLASGPHKLSIRCVQVDGDERHEGIGVMPFTVAP